MQQYQYSQDLLTGKRHKNIFDNIHPDSTSRIQLVYRSFMKFIQVQIINSFLRCDKQMLIPCIWMNPTCGTMNSQWTAIKYLLMFNKNNKYLINSYRRTM